MSRQLVALLLVAILTAAEAWWGNQRRRRTLFCEDVLEEVTVDTTDCKSVTKIRTVWVTVNKWKTINRTKKVYESMWRLANKTQEVEYLLPVADFYKIALDQITAEILTTCGASGPRNQTAGGRVQAGGAYERGGDDAESVAYVVYGRSQAGKSTLICNLREPGDPCPEVGDGSGDSVTALSLLWFTKIGPMLDAPGIDDTLLRFSKEEAGRRVAVGVASAGVSRVKFLVFDSMANDGMHLRDTLASLELTFGSSVLPGVVVVASKANLKQGSSGEKRLELMRQVMKNSGLEVLVRLPGPSLARESFDALQVALDRVPSVPLTELEDLWERQRRRAQELCDTQQPRKKDIVVQVNESYAVQREELEPHEVPYTESVPQEETYEVVECFPATKTTRVPRSKCYVP